MALISGICKDACPVAMRGVMGAGDACNGLDNVWGAGVWKRPRRHSVTVFAVVVKM